MLPITATDRPFNFDLFYAANRKGEKDKPKQNILEWFVGFAEGDGSWQAHERGTCAFIVTQSTEDLVLLQYIRSNLGFGRIIQQSSHCHRFVVQDKVGLSLITHIISGNIVFPTRTLIFQPFRVNTLLTSKRLSPITPITKKVIPTLSDARLSGYTDAEGRVS